MDSHADTCALAQDHCLVLQDTGKRVIVEGFGNAVQQMEGIPIVTAAVAHDCPTAHHTHTFLYFMSPC